MSYILEALRKSEGERDTGRVPDLASRHDFPDEEQEARRPLWPYALAGVFSLNVAVLAYVFWPKAQPAPLAPAAETQLAETPPKAPANAPVAEPMKSETPKPAERPVQPGAQAMQAVQPVQAYPNPAPAYGQQPAPAYAAYPAPGYGQVPVQPAPGYAQGAYPPPAYPVQQAYPVQGGYPLQGGYAQAGAYPAQAMPQAAYPPAQPAYGQAQMPNQPLPELADGETLVTPEGVQSQDADSIAELRQLPQELQAQVPPMAFSTHVYSSNPAKSFVVINGQSYGAGAQVFPGIVLEAIVEDAVVFNRMGQRFRLEAMKNWPNG
ncbi:MAG: general secretion pathway protein GspB [Gammaproteobacteria bacterium]|nr:general secretion pathway protein GspB [Gammaproteobacteria bacterium]